MGYIEGDGGYLDSFKALKQQIDYNYERYKEQLEAINKRSAQVNEDLKLAIKMAVIVFLIPVFMLVVMFITGKLGLLKLEIISGIFSMIFTIFYLVFAPVTIITEGFILPVMLKNVYNYYVQRELLNSDEFFKKYRKNKGIISFIDERKFLIDTIHKYDSFYEDIELRGLDRKDGIIRESLINGEMTEEQMAVLERMRSLSLFKEYKATVVETRKEVGLYTVLIIFGIILSILLIILSRTN
ncbi:MAG: SoxR reducing system RseC family protein, partial [Eubacterium sp.]|nr:SoxR reducing system RseC family protein [Eubacterium sp.]